MALDQQRNWTISMADNLDQSKRRGGKVKGAQQGNNKSETLGEQGSDQTADDVTSRPTINPIYLPDEIILQILEYISHTRESQKTLASCCLLSHQWLDAATPLLYARPYLYGKNYDPFVRAICPSINLHVRKSPLSELVKVLNMAALVHQGSKSLTARLLGRTKGSLEEFVAPVASFAMNCLPALSKCRRLRVLDLSLVSESPPVPDLFRTVAHLEELRTFRLPRSAGFGGSIHNRPPPALTWPPNLQDLSLSGGIDAHFLHGVVAFPQTLRSLTIEHCPLAKGFALNHMLRTAIRPLKSLESISIRYMPRLSSHALDDLLFLLPQIRRLSISVDYITPALFDGEGHYDALKSAVIDGDHTLGWTTENPNPLTNGPLQHQNLHYLELTNSGNPGVEDKISPIDIMIAIDEGVLPKLRQVRVAKSLLWHSSSTASDAEALADVLQEASKRDWETRSEEFRGINTEEGERRRVWEGVSGVWMFDG